MTSLGNVRLLAYTDSISWGGAEECLATLLAELSSRFAVAVVGVDANIVARIARARPEADAQVLPPYSSKADVHSLRVHVQAFRRLQPDICHLNMRTPWSCQAGILAALMTRRARIVAVEHLPLHSRSRFVRWTRHHVSRFYAAHVAVGGASARALEAELGLPAGSVRVVTNGVRPLAARTALRSARPTTIGTIGRLVPEKGHDILIRSLRELPDVRAIIHGDGPAAADLRLLAQRLDVADRLELPGWTDEPEEHLAALDIFVLPSFEEGMPLVALQAMFVGVPVVATRVGSVSEAIEDEVTGLLVPPGDAEALAAAVQRLIEDAKLGRRLVDAARAKALAVFSAQAMADRYSLLYEEVLG